MQQQLQQPLHQVASPLTALKIIVIYVYGCEKRKPKHISWIYVKNKFGNLNFVILDRYNCRAICRNLMNNTSSLDSWTDLHGFNI